MRDNHGKNWICSSIDKNLKDENVTVIFEGKLSGKDTDHPEFQKSLEYIR